MKSKVFLFAVTALVTHAAWAITPENGWWWNPAEPGRGFNIETQRGVVFIAAFVYDEAGSPVWYSGSGELKDSAVTTLLFRFDGGQCFGCPYQAPARSQATAPITIEFTSPGSGTVSWAGESIPIKRFNFNLAKGLQRLLGEWVFIPEEPSDVGSYRGDRITFSRVAEKGLVVGSRTGVPSRKAIAYVVATHSKFKYLAIIERSQFSADVFAFNFKGLNKIEGIGAPVNSPATQNEIWNALENSNRPFEAYRVH